MPKKDKTGPFGEGKDCDDSRGRNQGGKGFRGDGTGEGKGRGPGRSKGRGKGRPGKRKTTEGMLRDQQSKQGS